MLTKNVISSLACEKIRQIKALHEFKRQLEVSVLIFPWIWVSHFDFVNFRENDVKVCWRICSKFEFPARKLSTNNNETKTKLHNQIFASKSVNFSRNLSFMARVSLIKLSNLVKSFSYNPSPIAVSFQKVSWNRFASISSFSFSFRSEWVHQQVVPFSIP